MFMTACCIGLACWIAILILTLPGRYTSSDWQAAWVGLDIAELAGFAATAWAAWHQRQIVIFCMIITGTLLVCDAWFDLALDYGSPGFTTSLVSALVVELPLAFLLFNSARRLVRVTIATMMQIAGAAGPVPPLWRIPLFADGLEECLPARLRPQSTGAGARADVTAAGGPSSLGIRRSRGENHGHEPLRRIPPADVLDRLPDDRQRERRRGHRARGLPARGQAQDAARAAEAPSRPKAYLATITTRLAIDHLRSARVRRESYVGTWLPEPLIGNPEPDPAELAETSDSLSMAFLVLLESLAPAERAVFLLREVFGYDYGEIAGITGKTGKPPAGDLHPGPPPHRRGPAAVRNVPRRGRGAHQPVPGRGQRRRHDQPARAARPGRGVLRRQRRPGRDDVHRAHLRSRSSGRGGSDPGRADPSAGRLAPADLGQRAAGRAGLRRGRQPDRGHRVRRARRPGSGHPDVANPEKLRHIGPICRTWHLRWRDQDEGEEEEN